MVKWSASWKVGILGLLSFFESSGFLENSWVVHGNYLGSSISWVHFHYEYSIYSFLPPSSIIIDNHCHQHQHNHHHHHHCHCHWDIMPVETVQRCSFHIHPLISHLLITALSSFSRNTLGLSFPGCGAGVTLPISTKPKPALRRPSTASPCLSKPAAKPTGLGNWRPNTLVC